MKKSVPKKSSLEEVFCLQINELMVLIGGCPETEYKFHASRKWRFDFAWPTAKIAVEIMGGTWTGGAHVTGVGYENDCEKLNAAVSLGWKVLYLTSKMVRSGEGIVLVKNLLINYWAPVYESF